MPASKTGFEVSAGLKDNASAGLAIGLKPVG